MNRKSIIRHAGTGCLCVCPICSVTLSAFSFVTVIFYATTCLNYPTDAFLVLDLILLEEDC